MRKLKRSECAILRLVLKRKWYDMIASGEKREEYRDEKSYWNKRISRWFNLGMARVHHVVAFSLGYAKPTMLLRARCVVLTNHRTAHPKWGEPDTPHWVITLGERVELEADNA